MLLVESQPQRRASLLRALRTVGLPVVAVPSVAHVERWPAGQIVATEAARFTPFWKEVGASHVFVLADSEAEGLACCARGATLWLPRTCRPHLLVSAVQAVSAGNTAFATDRAPDPVAAPMPVGGAEAPPPAASRLELIVRHGAHHRFEMLKSKSVGLPVVVRWDRRNQDSRPQAAAADRREARPSERRQSPPYTWEVADFVLVERAADVPQMEE
jgi:hypothetical protein